MKSQIMKDLANYTADVSVTVTSKRLEPHSGVEVTITSAEYTPQPNPRGRFNVKPAPVVHHPKVTVVWDEETPQVCPECGRGEIIVGREDFYDTDTKETRPNLRVRCLVCGHRETIDSKLVVDA